MLGLYTFRLCAAWLIAQPAASSLSAAFGHFAEGDRKLFEDGGLYLLEVLLAERVPLTAMASTASWSALLVSFAALVPLWAVLNALSPHGRLEALSTLAARQLPSFALLGGLSWLCRIVVLFAVGTAAISARSALVETADERLADVATLAVLGVGVLVWLGLSAFHDVCRALIVHRDVTGATALSLTVRAAGPGLGALLTTLTLHAGLTLLSTLLVVGGARLAQWADVSQPGAWRVVLCLLLHQAIVLSLIGLRTLWLSLAVNRAQSLDEP
jgi:hypothetical protein